MVSLAVPRPSGSGLSIDRAGRSLTVAERLTLKYSVQLANQSLS